MKVQHMVRSNSHTWRSNGHILGGGRQRERKKKKLHIAPNLFEAVTLHESWHVISCVFINMPQLSSERRPQLCVQDQFGLWGGGSGGDPLSVMGQGHTMGALCQICWGCTAVGKGLALISVRMFTGVCRVWKVIRSLTFPSHNHLRMYISSVEKKKCAEKKIKKKRWIFQRTDSDFQGRKLQTRATNNTHR